MYDNIVVPISFDEDRDADGAIAVAQALQAKGGTITLLHVIEKAPGYALSYLPEDYLRERRGAIESELSFMASKHAGATAAVVNGHSGRTICDWAESHGADLVVIASHRPGMQDLLLGSTAQFVVRHASCAVHVLR